MNGFGPCGAFQYGNFVDFTINVGLGTTVADMNQQGFVLSPNPAQDELFLDGFTEGLSNLSIMDLDGRLCHVAAVNERSGRQHLDIR